MSNVHIFLDAKEEEAYLAHLDGHNTLIMAADAIGISIKRIDWHRKHYHEFDKKVKAYSKKFRSGQIKSMSLARLAENGKTLTDEQKSLVSYWLQRGATEKEACVKSGCDFSQHNLTKLRENLYFEQCAYDLGVGHSLIEQGLEYKLLKFLSKEWSETIIEYKALINKAGRPILDKNGDSRLFINKITHKNLPREQSAAMIEIITKLLPAYSQKIQVAQTHVNISSKPKDVKEIIMERIKSLEQKQGELNVEALEYDDAEFKIKEVEVNPDLDKGTA